MNYGGMELDAAREIVQRTLEEEKKNTQTHQTHVRKEVDEMNTGKH